VTSSVQAVQGVTYPALSKLSDDDAKLSEGYRRILVLTSFVLFPAMLGFVAIAPEMFMLLLGEKWMPTVPFFEILALSGIFYPLSIVAYNILKVKSDGRVILRLELIKRAVMTLILALTIPLGIEAVAWGMTAMSFVDFVVNVVAARRYVTITIGTLVRSIAPQLVVALTMFVALCVINPYLTLLHNSLHLVIDIVFGAVAYLSLAYTLRLRSFTEAVELARGLITKRN
jgi:O-antigen/teichoic acid export membrane protein